MHADLAACSETLCSGCSSKFGMVSNAIFEMSYAISDSSACRLHMPTAHLRVHIWHGLVVQHSITQIYEQSISSNLLQGLPVCRALADSMQCTYT